MAVGHHVHVKGGHDLPYTLLPHKRKCLLKVCQRAYAGYRNERHASEIMHDISLERAFYQQYGILRVACDVRPRLRAAAVLQFGRGQPTEFSACHVVQTHL